VGLEFAIGYYGEVYDPEKGLQRLFFFFFSFVLGCVSLVYFLQVNAWICDGCDLRSRGLEIWSYMMPFLGFALRRMSCLRLWLTLFFSCVLASVVDDAIRVAGVSRFLGATFSSSSVR